jgi:hypothetical protein
MMPADRMQPARIGRAGEHMVAAELLRRGLDVAVPCSDVGVDLIAYQARGMGRSLPIQVKARSGPNYNSQRSWFRVPGIALVQIWNVATSPEFYVFANIEDVEAALGSQHAATPSWLERGGYSVTAPTGDALDRMARHKDRWDRITGQFPAPPSQA